MSAPSNPQRPPAPSGIREQQAAGRELNRRQRELVIASLVACPARAPRPASKR